VILLRYYYILLDIILNEIMDNFTNNNYFVMHEIISISHELFPFHENISNTIYKYELLFKWILRHQRFAILIPIYIYIYIGIFEGMDLYRWHAY
jgi:hypothetical protein